MSETYRKEELLELAERMTERSYAPYSAFRVGAALLCRDGRIFTGCNVENVSYSATVCAERSAFFSAVAEGCGKGDFRAIALAARDRNERVEKVLPCGVCRQVMSEFCTADFEIVTGDENGVLTYTLAQLQPEPFLR